VNETDEIRRQMAQIRHEMHQNVSSVVSGVSGVVQDVSDVMDWRTLVRGHPYLLVSAALVMGYLMVPRRKPALEAAQNSLASLAAPEASRRRKRLHPLSAAVDMLWPIATQAAQAYAMIWIENRLKQYLRPGPNGQAFDEPEKSALLRGGSVYPRRGESDWS
jgi:hypothetical protein